MPYSLSDNNALQLQIAEDTDGSFHVRYEGERIVTVSALALTAADKQALGRALISRWPTAPISVVNASPPIVATTVEALATATS